MDKRKRRLLCMLEGSGRKSRWISGAPPLSFKAFAAGTLENYRIYGNTVDGESVGDLVESGEHAGEYKVPVTVEGKNLFDESATSTINGYKDGKYINRFGGEVSESICAISEYILIPEGANMISMNVPIILYSPSICFYGNDKTYISGANYNNRSVVTEFIPVGAKYLRFTVVKQYADTTMLNEGSTALPYEPYHAPVTTPIYLPEPIKMVGDEAEYIDYGEQKQHRVRKNLLPNTVKSETTNGVTFTVNSDHSITINGTASRTIDLHLIPSSFLLPVGKYRLTGAPSGGSVSSYYLRAWYMSSGSVVWITDSGNGINFTLTDITAMISSIVIMPGQVVDNLTFYPMIRKADIEDNTYEPYIENTDVDVTLPALPTLTGTNVLSVGTEVQPSRMDIKGRIKSLT